MRKLSQKKVSRQVCDTIIKQNLLSVWLFYNPVVNGTGLGIEMYACHHHVPPFGLVGCGISFLLDLLKCLLSPLVSLQLQNIGGVRHQHDHVYATSGTSHLGTHIDVEHGEDKIESILIEALGRGCLLKFLLKTFHVGEAGQVGLHLAEGKVEVMLLQRTPEL